MQVQRRKMFSEYFETLNRDAKARYIEKIKLINNIDPYLLSKRELSSNEEDFPDLSYVDMVNYLVYGVSHYTSEDFKAYKSLQSYNQFRCGWVFDVYVKVVSDMRLVLGKVRHSQRLAEKPLEPWFISTSVGIVQSAHCTCMAGLGEACTHVAALMFFVQNVVINKNEASVTSVAPYWGQPKKSVIFAEVKNINFSTPSTCKEPTSATVPLPPAIPRMNENEFKSLCTELRAANCNSAILNVVKGFNDSDSNRLYLSNLFKEDFLKYTLKELQEAALAVNLNIDAIEAEAISKQTILQSKSREWFLYRAGRITASSLKSICSTDINAPAISTIKKICYPSKMLFNSKPTWWGCKHEKEAKKEYITFQKRIHPTIHVSSCGLIINPNYPYLGASPDGLVECECCGLGCLEVKCPYCLRKEEDVLEDHKCLKVIDGNTVLSKKHAYYYQVQCQLFVSNRSYCDFVLWKKNEIYVERIKADHEFWTEVSVQAENFFKKILLPEMMGMAFTHPYFPDGTDRKSVAMKKNPTIVFL